MQCGNEHDPGKVWTPNVFFNFSHFRPSLPEKIKNVVVDKAIDVKDVVKAKVMKETGSTFIFHMHKSKKFKTFVYVIQAKE